jgi:UDPglucose 6-dehydrogenase
MAPARPLLPESVVYCTDALDAAAGADALVLITEWNEFRALSPVRLGDAMRGRVLVDLRNVYDPVGDAAVRLQVSWNRTGGTESEPSVLTAVGIKGKQCH